MYLSKLEIQGFKSFAQKTVLTFPASDAQTKGITAIVGPNGSGKSNVADAIRWVLGEQSLKLLRGKKSEDVIFFGSDKKNQLGLAEVSLYFNNEDGALPVEYGEVVITRRVYRNGESEYLLNKAKVRLTDIVLLLAQGNVGQRTYSVIGQGMIDSIVNAAAAERRDFFYEAAGVKQYQIKKDAALARLKTSEDNLAQSTLVRAELEPKLAFFARQLERRAERVTLEQQLSDLQKGWYHRQWEDLAHKIAGVKAREAQIEEEITRADGVLAALQAKYTETERQRDTSSDTHLASLRERQRALRGQYQQLLKEQSVLEGRLQAAYEQQGEQNIAWLMTRKSELVSQIAQLNEECETLTRETYSTREAMQEVETLLSSLGGQISALQQKIREATPTRHAVSLASLTESLRASHAMLEELRDDVAHEVLREMMIRVRTSLGDILTSLDRAERPDTSVLDALETELDQMRTEQERVRGTLQSHRVSHEVGMRREKDLAVQRERALREQEKVEKDLAYFTSQDTKARHTLLEQQQRELVVRLEAVTTELDPLEREISRMYAESQRANSALLTLQKEINAASSARERVRNTLHEISLERARLDARQDDLFIKIVEECALVVEENAVRDSVLRGYWGEGAPPTFADPQETQREMGRIRHRLERIGVIDEDIVAEYEATQERATFLQQQIEDLTGAIANLHATIKDLDGIIRTQFRTSLEAIDKKFTHYFAELFNGGAARLVVIKKEREEGEEETEESTLADEVAGVEIHATPPGKKLKTIAVLSGGEKALTAIALICAIMATNPSPFVLLDEVDAALDDANAFRFAHIITELAHTTQFVVITHSQVTMHAARILYGVTMGDDGVSKIVSLDFAHAQAMLDKAA